MRHRHSVTDEPMKLAGIAAVAAAIGAAVAMLVTPRDGKHLRKDLKRKAASVKDQVQDTLSHAVDEVGDTTDEAKQQLQTTATKVADEAKAKTSKAKTSTTSTASRAKTTAKRVASKTHKTN